MPPTEATFLPTSIADSPDLSLQSRVERVCRELDRAIRGNRGLIIIAVYASEITRTQALGMILANTAKKVNSLKAREFQVKSKKDADIPYILAKIQEDKPSKNLFFTVSGLKWDGEDGKASCRGLNVWRELFSKKQIRMVLWVTEQEARLLPQYASDFWVFRHRTVDFLDAPDFTQDLTFTGVLISGLMTNSSSSPEAINAEIELRTAILHDLPAENDVISLRINLYVTLSKLYSQQDDKTQARQFAQRASALMDKLPNNVDGNKISASIYEAFGILEFQLKNYDKALAHFDQAITLHSNNAVYYEWKGFCYGKLAQFENVLSSFQQAVKLNPTQSTFYHNIGVAYFNLGRYEEALSAYQQSIKLTPKHTNINLFWSKTYQDIGKIYYKLKRYKEALSAYQQAITWDDQKADFYSYMGDAYFNLNYYENALSAYKHAIKLDPQNANYHGNLGDLFHYFGNYEKAIEAYQTALQLEQNNKGENNLGNTFFMMGCFDDADAHYQKASLIDPSEPTTIGSITNLYRKLGKRAEYDSWMQKLHEAYKNESDAFKLACVEAIAENNDKALELLERAIQDRPINRLEAQHLPAFDTLRQDARFWELVKTNDKQF